MITEARAWRLIAEKLERELAQPSGRMVAGLCREVNLLAHEDRVIDMDMECRMCDRITAHKQADPSEYLHAYHWEMGEIGPRIMAATLLALECKEEGV